MLVDSKFYFISLPRCASTSFLVNCLKQGIPVKHGNFTTDVMISKANLKLPNEILIDTLYHSHEKIQYLENKLGYGYDIISVKRNRHERFISTWKHVLDELYRINEMDVYNKFKTFDENDLLFFNHNDLIDENLVSLINEIIKKYDLKYENRYVKVILSILLRPTSYWHNHDPRIKWFDIKELHKLEEWVSNKLNMEFKLEKTNSSQHFDCNLKLTDNFIKRYNQIYDYFDLPKTKISIF
jgi:hypothetical protein